MSMGGGCLSARWRRVYSSGVHTVLSKSKTTSLGTGESGGSAAAANLTVGLGS